MVWLSELIHAEEDLKSMFIGIYSIFIQLVLKTQDWSFRYFLRDLF